VADSMTPAKFLRMASHLSSAAPSSRPTKHFMQSANWFFWVKGSCVQEHVMAEDQVVRMFCGLLDRLISLYSYT
jgi:hypothetical protein